MLKKKKYFVAVMALFFAFGAFAEDKNIATDGNFEQGQENWTLRNCTIVDGGPEGSKKCLNFSDKVPWGYARHSELIALDIKSPYLLKASIKGNGKSSVSIGFECYDKDKKRIMAFHVDYYPDTNTELVEDAKTGDSVLKVKDAETWKKGYYCHVAFNIDDSDDFKDLPNSDVSERGITKIEQKGDVWQITLKKPLRNDYPKGTKIREHQGNYVSSGAFAPIYRTFLGEEWEEFEQALEGTGVNESIKGAREESKWRAGTAFVKVLVHASPKGKQVQVDNISLIKSK